MVSAFEARSIFQSAVYSADESANVSLQHTVTSGKTVREIPHLKLVGKQAATEDAWCMLYSCYETEQMRGCCFLIAKFSSLWRSGLCASKTKKIY